MKKGKEGLETYHVHIDVAKYAKIVTKGNKIAAPVRKVRQIIIE